jgi:cell wall-associated NlpC family hydrolase
MLSVESMESRLCLSSGGQVPTGSGVDSIAMGDVNGDQIADVAVATHENGQYEVSIYSGAGQANTSYNTGYAPQLLATILDPFSPADGPLDVALGDFAGTGVSELAISSEYSNQISVWKFQQSATAIINGPLNAPVIPVSTGPLFTPAGLQDAKGINLAAVSFSGNGVYQLVATPATNGPGKVVVLSYGSQTGWQVTQTIGSVPVDADQGLSVSAGVLTNDGMPNIVVGSQADGKVAVYSEELQSWVATTSPLGKKAKDVRVAVDSSEGESGSLVVTSGQAGAKAVIVPWGGTAKKFLPHTSPGSGALIPLGAGYVYRPSTIRPKPSSSTADDSSTFKHSPGPATPDVLFASTGGSGFVVQEFKPHPAHGSTLARFTPSGKDTYVEPLSGSLGNGFIPLQVTSDPDATGQAVTKNKYVPIINIVVLPKNDYTSPFSIDLSGVPASVTAGLEPVPSPTPSSTDPWGPTRVPNAPPAINSQTTVQSLQERVIAAYASFIGVDYQHHYDPSWAPTQQDPWNVTGTLAYQSPGVDCTNFTAAAYADALGIVMSGDTTTQSDITTGNTYLNGHTAPGSNYIKLPTNADGSAAGVDSFINVQTFSPSAWGNTYQGLVNFLQPGDILYIKGSPTGKVTHAITWLGQYGVDSKGVYQHLIIDSTGITPQHVDSNNRIIPEGVQIRPFADGNGSTPNTWYFADVSHVMRILGTPTSSPTS